MYLKEIDLLGFKSFTEKTKICLEPGISCIVGPNGSGKSNISDALRWVFGEQSARSLRGGKLEDVIFSGSKGRKPLGMAEVSIVLDNSDGHLNQPFTEVVVTRRAFRSGQSEYLINNQPCRLKDITSLFLDSGMGMEGISLIGQGEISNIVSARPEEIRAIVEDAAGIVKYRNRKRESVRKLNETENHLLRLGDIIGELSARLEPLAEQARVAEQYLQLKEEKDAMEIGISLRVLTDAGERLAKIESALQEAQNQVLEEESARLAIEAQSEQLANELNQLDQALAALQEHFFKTQNAKNEAKGQIEMLQAQRDGFLKEKQRLERELEALAQKQESQKAEKAELESQQEALVAEMQAREQQLLAGEDDEKSRKAALTLLSAKLNEAKDAAFALANALADCRNRLRYQQQLEENQQAAQARLRAQAQELAAAESLIAKEETELAGTLANNQQALEALQNALGELNKQQEAQNSRVQALAEQETACRYDMQSVQSRLHILADMMESGEGFFPGVKSILLAKKKQKAEVAGVVDVIANLLDVPEDYITAIESYLGGAIQNIVVEDEKAAQTAISYLKREHGGRATFLPLDILKPREKGDFSPALGQKGVLGRASELVGCEARMRPAVDFLLNNLLVVADMEAASRAAKLLRYRVSVVTLDGDMIHPGASISGGSRKQKGNDFLSKRKQIENYQKQLAKQQAELQGLETALAEARSAAKTLEAQAANLNAEIAEKHRENQAQQNRRQQLALQKEMQRKQLANLHAETQELDNQRNAILNQMEEINEEMQTQQNAYAEAERLVSALSSELQQKEGNLDAGRADITRYKVELARLAESKNALSARLADLEKAQADLLWDQEEKAADLQTAEQGLQESLTALTGAEEAFVRLDTELLEAESRLNQERHGLAAENNRLQELQAAAKNKRKQVDEQRQRAHEQEVKKARLEAEWQNEEKKLEERFALSFAMAQARWQENGLSKTAMGNRLAQLNREINALGDINVGAIQEYAEVRERHQFLSEQCADLRAAKASLLQVIQEMDGIMTSRFRQTLQALSEAFSVSFRRLFGGGSASLALVEPENILESGVAISVKPPGKKVHHYNLLSGGEKSLCGIALMFAVLAVRPTPFCVMDEVDSALDEANVERFAQYLQELSAHTQFLMISHRHGTMEAASALWGVTMEEEGVSKMVSVRLNKQNPAQIAG